MNLQSHINRDPQKFYNVAWISLLVTSILLVVAVDFLMKALSTERFVLSREAEFVELGNKFTNSVERLSKYSRRFVINLSQEDLDKYWDEVKVKHTRDNTLIRLGVLNATADELMFVQEAKENSDKLINIDTFSMRLILSTNDKLQSHRYFKKDNFTIPKELTKLSVDQKLNKARELVFSKKYEDLKQDIQISLLKYQKKLKERMIIAAAEAGQYTSTILLYVIILSTIILLLVIALIWFRHILKKAV